MIVTVLMECSGEVRDRFIAAGHDAISVDLLPTMAPGPHAQMDAFEFMETPRGRATDLAIAHPTCTFLTCSGLHWNKRPGYEWRAAETEAALLDIERLWKLPVKKLAFENPKGCIPTRLGHKYPGLKRYQVVQPYNFGHDASKGTCIWSRDENGDPLPELEPTVRVPGRWVVDPRNGKLVERWANQTDSGQNRLPPSEDRWLLRSLTYPGIAQAMVKAWGGAAVRQSLADLTFHLSEVTSAMERNRVRCYA
jgi:hypothetical protein